MGLYGNTFNKQPGHYNYRDLKKLVIRLDFEGIHVTDNGIRSIQWPLDRLMKKRITLMWRGA